MQTAAPEVQKQTALWRMGVVVQWRSAVELSVDLLQLAVSVAVEILGFWAGAGPQIGRLAASPCPLSGSAKARTPEAAR